MTDVKKDYDFSCWVIKYGVVGIRGLTYQRGSLTEDEDKIVPLLWAHNHFDATSVLGMAVLEYRDEGVYAYCKLTGDETLKNVVTDIIGTRGAVSLSPFVNGVRIEDMFVVHGRIGEVSLVLARVDPDEAYYPVMRSKDGYFA